MNTWWVKYIFSIKLNLYASTKYDKDKRKISISQKPNPNNYRIINIISSTIDFVFNTGIMLFLHFMFFSTTNNRWAEILINKG